MSFQVGVGSLGGTVFSGGAFYPSANYDSLQTDSLPGLNYVKYKEI